jgi:hypothetical protein
MASRHAERVAEAIGRLRGAACHRDQRPGVGGAARGEVARDSAGAQYAAGQFPPRPFVHRDVLVLHIEEHPDSDGARLAAGLFQFDAAGRFPVILRPCVEGCRRTVAYPMYDMASTSEQRAASRAERVAQRSLFRSKQPKLWGFHEVSHHLSYEGMPYACIWPPPGADVPLALPTSQRVKRQRTIDWPAEAMPAT